MMDMDDQAEIERAHLFLDRLSERALRLDGTCTGEHGVGQGKIQYLDAEHGTGAMNLMRRLKRSVDPDNIMNPGKIFML
jgi:D-lactate dehydrogenase (cytochrome)